MQHVTLDTGHARHSPRAEVADTAVVTMRDSLAEALAPPGGRVPVPGVPGYSYNATALGSALLVTLWGTAAGDVPPVVTFGIAREAGAGRALWRQLHQPRGGLERTPYRTDAAAPPRAPWLAARLEIGSRLVDAGDLLWMADFERVTAWAWIELETS